MLLEEHGCHTDQNRQNHCGRENKLLPAQRVAVVYGDTDGDRVKHMNARAYIGGGVGCIQRSYNIDQNIVAAQGIQIRAEILTVRPDRINDQANCHSRKQVSAAAVKIASGCKEEVPHRYCNEGEP